MLLNQISTFFSSLSAKTRRCLLMSALVPLTPLMLHNTMQQLEDRKLRKLNCSTPLKVSVGCAVYLESPQDQSRSWLTLVATPNANTQQGELSILSPLGQALLGKDVGDEVNIKVLGAAMRFLVVEITRTQAARGNKQLSLFAEHMLS